MRWFQCFIIFAVLGSHVAWANGLEAELYINGQKGNKMIAGSVVMLELRVKDPSMDSNEMGQALRDFIPMHKKIMHMVILKKDLSHFTHVHPFYDEGHGVFAIPLNIGSFHPDNFGTVNALPSPGEYVVFAEAKSRKYGMVMFRQEITVLDKKGEAPGNWRRPLNHKNQFQKFFNPEGQEVGVGGYFQLSMKQNFIPGCGGNLVSFRLQVEQLDESGNSYVEGQGLEKWLMMGGHAILAHDRGEVTMADYFHLHADLPEGESVYEYNVFDRGQLEAGPYKIWFQVKVQGQVLTVPFVFDFVPGAQDPNSCE